MIRICTDHLRERRHIKKNYVNFLLKHAEYYFSWEFVFFFEIICPPASQTCCDTITTADVPTTRYCQYFHFLLYETSLHPKRSNSQRSTSLPQKCFSFAQVTKKTKFCCGTWRKNYCFPARDTFWRWWCFCKGPPIRISMISLSELKANLAESTAGTTHGTCRSTSVRPADRLSLQERTFPHPLSTKINFKTTNCMFYLSI